MDEIFGDSDVRRVFELVGGGVAPRLDDLDDHDRELIMQFLHADQNPDKLATQAMLIDACVGGVRAFEQLSDPMARSWAAGWKKFVLYITALNTQTLWDRFQNGGQSDETAIFADWVVFSIGHQGWGPDGNSTPLGKQHSYCMAVAAEAGGGIKENPRTGLFEAPDGSAARNYDPAARLPVGLADGSSAGPVPAGTDAGDAYRRASARGRPVGKPEEKLMTSSNYLNLFLDAGISRDQEKYSRCLDAVLAQEGITVDDILGLGENGIGANELYVVHRRAVTLAQERGVFNKRIEVRQLCPIASIARLRTTQEGFKPPELTITAYDADGKVVSKIVWTLPFEDWEKRLVLRQREHLFKVISAAVDKER